MLGIIRILIFGVFATIDDLNKLGIENLDAILEFVFDRLVRIPERDNLLDCGLLDHRFLDCGLLDHGLLDRLFCHRNRLFRNGDDFRLELLDGGLGQLVIHVELGLEGHDLALRSHRRERRRGGRLGLLRLCNQHGFRSGGGNNRLRGLDDNRFGLRLWRGRRKTLAHLTQTHLGFLIHQGIRLLEVRRAFLYRSVERIGILRALRGNLGLTVGLRKAGYIPIGQLRVARLLLRWDIRGHSRHGSGGCGGSGLFDRRDRSVCRDLGGNLHRRRTGLRDSACDRRRRCGRRCGRGHFLFIEIEVNLVGHSLAGQRGNRRLC